MEDSGAAAQSATDTRKGLTFVRMHWNMHHSTERPFCPSTLVPDTDQTILSYCTNLVKTQLHKRQKKAHNTKSRTNSARA
jgi:hypothetical protein